MVNTNIAQQIHSKKKKENEKIKKIQETKKGTKTLTDKSQNIDKMH